MFYSTSNGGDTKPLLMLESKGNASSQQRCRQTDRETSMFVWVQWEAQMPVFQSFGGKYKHSTFSHFTVSKNSPLQKIRYHLTPRALFSSAYIPNTVGNEYPEAEMEKGHSCSAVIPIWVHTRAVPILGDSRPMYPSFPLQAEAKCTSAGEHTPRQGVPQQLSPEPYHWC